MTTHERATAAIAAQNDAFRRRFGMTSLPGQFLVTRGIAALSSEDLLAILQAVRAFDRFTPDNDPWKEHDCGRLEVNGHVVIWKMDYYEDEAMTFSAEDPRTSYRVLTVMLAEEY